MIAAGVLLVLVALGYLLFRAQEQAGLGSAEQAYERWISGFAAGLGDRPAVVILEPDALAQLGLWIKAPGESDGNCGVGSGTQAGEFSPALATKLITGST